jgi:hypothetical protein
MAEGLFVSKRYLKVAILLKLQFINLPQIIFLLFRKSELM